MTSLTYAAVIATRNRPQALELSLPLLLKQSRPPAQVIIVDSSDDGAQNQDIVDRNSDAFDVDIEYIRSAPGSSLQRNIGLKKVAHPIVLFPDDDSLLLPGAMDVIMRTYERDKEHLVGGVCAADADLPPEGVLKSAAYQMSRPDRIRHALAGFRRRIERLIVPDPFLHLADRHYAAIQHPDWVDGKEHVLVEYMTGYRMSFRTELIRAEPFDENLGRYALYEDSDLSLRVLKSHALVGARQARIYHYKVPDKRDRGYAMGVMNILNRAYVMAKQGVRSRRFGYTVKIFEFYKLLQYALDRSEYGRERFKGAREAMRFTEALFGARPDDVANVYLRARASLGLDGQSPSTAEVSYAATHRAGAMNV